MKDALGLTELDYKRIKIQQRIHNFLNAKCMLPVYAFHFGYQKASRLNRVKSDRMKWLDTCYAILCEDFSDFLKQYHFLPPAETSEKQYIWVCWLQGEAFMPEVVRCCIRSIRKHAPAQAEVVLITADNLKDYVQFPAFLYQRLKSGSLTMTHFSDLIRMALLKNYGGLWIDATVFVSAEIPKAYFEKDLFSIQILNPAQRHENPYYGGVTSFLVGGSPQCMLFDFCESFFIEYQRRYGYLLDVHLINLCYRLAYDHFPEVQAAVDEIGVNNGNVQALYKAMDAPYDRDQFAQITDNQIFHKLNWRKSYHEIVNGVCTMYGYIKQSVE